MATLISNPGLDDNLVQRFDFGPIFPTVDGPKNAYQVRIWRDDVVVFEETYDVEGRKMGHMDVESIARIFQLAPQILSRTVPIQDPDSEGEEGEEYISLQEDVNWLDVMIRGFKLRREERVWVRLYLRTDMKSTEPVILVPLVSTRFICSPEAAYQFGIELTQELKSASRERWNMSCPAPDDFPPDDEEEPKVPTEVFFLDKSPDY